MKRSSSIGFGGVLLGFGIGWVAIKYFGATWDIIPYLLILAGVGIVLSSLVLKQQKSVVSELAGGLIGGLIIAVVFSSVFGFSSFFPFGPSITGSGIIVNREFDYQGFSAVDAGYGFNLEIVKGDDYSISVSLDDNVLDSLEVTKSGDTLSIGLEPGNYQHLNLEAMITMPSLKGVTLSGGSQGDVSGFYSSSDFNLELSGGSEITMVGSAGDIKIDASGGSRVYLSDFVCNDADVGFSGGSNGSINVEGTLDADLSGGSHLNYYGDPDLGDIDTSSGSTITPK